MASILDISDKIDLAFLKKSGNEFEDFIVRFYKIDYPELLVVKPQGSKGDGANDNRLFDMVDEREIAKAFEYTNANVSQYICSISDTKFDEAKLHSDIDFNKFVIKNLNEKKKLFGFDFDI